MKTVSMLRVVAAVVFATSAMSMVACTKLRDPSFPSGGGLNLLETGVYNNKTFDIQTTTPVGQTRASSRAESLTANAQSIGVGAFAIVNYTVSDAIGKKLLADTPIVGKPATTYEGLIQLTDTHVKVFKVGTKADIPSDEQTYAMILDDGRLAVPLIGYPLQGKYTIEKRRNDRGETTTELFEKEALTIAGATHMRIDFSRPEIFQAVVKTDVLPKNYFDGEWFYSETIVLTPDTETDIMMGLPIQEDSSTKPAAKVKFMLDETSASIVNLNIDKRLVSGPSVNFKKTATIPVKWKAYQIADQGRALREEENTEGHWNQRPYIQLDLGDTKTPSLPQGGAKLIKVEITEDYFSFTTEVREPAIRVKYSLMKAKPSNYVGKRMFEDDFKKFGYFTAERAVVRNFEVSRREDIEKNVLLARFNGKKGKIVYHFTKTTPEWTREMSRRVVKSWDKAFADAGTDIRVELDESFDVELGDLRYNVVNVVENLATSGTYGFGPSVSDLETGEIISASSNLYMTPLRASVIESTREYIAMKTGQLEEGRIAGIAPHLTALESMRTTTDAQGRSIVATPAITREMKLTLPMPNEENPNSFTTKQVVFKPAHNHFGEQNVALSDAGLHERIEQLCPEVASYIEELKAKGQTHNEKESQVLDQCSKKTVEKIAEFALVHEMGHNFGLRHNFTGSNDSANFLSKEVTQTTRKVKTSSIMDYPAFNGDILTQPGPYDVAAIRFGYADEIESASGELVKLDTTKSIQTNLSTKGLQRKNYKFCTDEHVEMGIDPMCMRQDDGETPLEVVRTIIATFQASYQDLNYRRGRAVMPDPQKLLNYRIQAFHIPLLRFYQTWRLGLSRFVGRDNEYLERMSQRDLQTTIENMKNNPEFAEFTKNYEPAAREVFAFYRNLANISNRYCVVKNMSTEQLQLAELMKAREQLFFSARATVRDCEDAVPYFTQNNLELMKTGNKPIEFGQELQTFRFDMSPQAATEPVDVIGALPDRMIAINLLSIREPLSIELAMRGFKPSFMDEPSLRADLKTAALSRLLDGVDGKTLLTDQQAHLFSPEVVQALRKAKFNNFAAEKDIVMSLLGTMINGNVVPGKQDITLTRLASMKGIYTNNLTNELRARAVALAQLPGGTFLVVTDPAAQDAIKIIEKYQQLAQLKSAQPFDTNDAANKALVDKLNEVLPTNETVAQLLPAQAKEILNQVMPLAQEAAKKNQSAVVAILNDLLMSGQLADSIATLAEQNPNQAKIEGDKPVVDHFKAQGGEYKLTKENLPALISELNQVATFYDSNRVEIDAQYDLLISVITQLGQI